jgi:hypothetical protein
MSLCACLQITSHGNAGPPAVMYGYLTSSVIQYLSIWKMAMSVNIKLSPELESRLAARAAAQGVPLPEYLQRVIEEHAWPAGEKSLTATERAALWRKLAEGLPDTAPLSDEAIGRESIYGTCA